MALWSMIFSCVALLVIETSADDRPRVAKSVAERLFPTVAIKDQRASGEKLPRPCRYQTWDIRKRSSAAIWNRLVRERCTDIPALKVFSLSPFFLPLLRHRHCPLRYVTCPLFPTVLVFAVQRAATAPKCRLAMIAAGMPRTGSTLTFKVLKAVLSKLTIWKSHGVQLKYWQWHLRNSAVPHRGPLGDAPPGSECETRWQLYNEATAKLNSLQEDDVVLIKSHEFDAELLSLCTASIVFTSERDVADIAASKVKLGWVHRKGNMSNRAWVAELAGGIKGDVSEHVCWRQHAPVNVNVLFSDASKCGWYYLHVAKALRGVLSRGGVNQELFSSAEVAEFDVWCRSEEMNRGQPATSTGHTAGATLSEDVANALRRQFANWQAQHNWSTGIPFGD